MHARERVKIKNLVPLSISVETTNVMNHDDDNGRAGSPLQGKESNGWQYRLRNRAYRYDSLSSKSSFRLLEVLPGRPGQVIKLRLHHADWKSVQTPQYEAISYFWGDGSNRIKCVCNDKPFWLTRNLHEAFDHLRYARKPRMLWADAVWYDGPIDASLIFYGHLTEVVSTNQILANGDTKCSTCIPYMQVLLAP